MKIDAKFKIRKIAGESIIVNQGTSGADLTKIISLNSSACLLFEKLSNKEFTSEDASKVLSENYRIDQDQAKRDAETWIEALKKCQVII